MVNLFEEGGKEGFENGNKIFPHIIVFITVTFDVKSIY